MNGGFKCAFLVQKWQLLPCWDVLEVLPQMATTPQRIWPSVSLEVCWAFQAFMLALGTSTGMPSCAFHWQKLVPENFPTWHGKGSEDPGLCWRNWGHCTPCLRHRGDGAKYCLSWHQHCFSPYHFALLISVWLTQWASESIYLDFFFLVFCQMFNSSGFSFTCFSGV